MAYQMRSLRAEMAFLAAETFWPAPRGDGAAKRRDRFAPFTRRCQPVCALTRRAQQPRCGSHNKAGAVRPESDARPRLFTPESTSAQHATDHTGPDGPAAFADGEAQAFLY